ADGGRSQSHAAGDETVGDGLPGFPTIALRATTDWQPLAVDIRGIVTTVEPGVTVDAIAPLDALASGSLVRPRLYAVLLGAFAAIAGVLAVVGVYGVLAFAVAQRTHEIGVRMALGAKPRTVLGAVLGEGLAIALAGIAIGVAAATGLTRYFAGMLYGLTAL